MEIVSNLATNKAVKFSAVLRLGGYLFVIWRKRTACYCHANTSVQTWRLSVQLGGYTPWHTTTKGANLHAMYTSRRQKRWSTIQAKLIHFLSIYFIWFSRSFGIISPQNIHSEVKILKYVLTWCNKVTLLNQKYL